ncbi:putative disease resistance protein RGA3 isoform X2 [Amaranthus tricolor]|nr:putative disease resistance protein RGA3 isoform X2 [Amaranthus tricolor]
MLIASDSVMGCVSVIAIVGFGGIGKTTLAQLIFNDDKIKEHFDLTKWACVPEFNNHKEIVGKIFNSFTGKGYHKLPLQKLKSGIVESIEKKRYLLVLDDVWDESRDHWLCLMSLLQCGASGSKILLTTRSDVVAEVVGDNSKAYRLGLLEDEEAWMLFKSLACRPGQEESDPRLSSIGRDIVKKCGNVPLAIRVCGTTLYSKKSEKEWQLFRDAQISKANSAHSNSIMPELKLSYDYLPPALKQCFAYCSLFPEDYKFSKDELVHLWMAQGYLDQIPLNESCIHEEVGHQYFLELLRKNLFQDAEEDDSLNDNIYCKMHDLVHQLAQHVSNDESILIDRTELQFTDEIMHASISSTSEESWKELQKVFPSLLAASKLRSLLFTVQDVGVHHFDWKNLGFYSLRSLDLKNMEIHCVPDFIEELKHLRYLNLAGNRFKSLPDALTRLVNLQTLNLDECGSLQELPRGFTTLEKLRHLRMKECPIEDMPLGFELMKSLCELNLFVVGNTTGIAHLPGLHLRGELAIRFLRWHSDATSATRKVSLKDNKQLTRLSLHFNFRDEVFPADFDDLLGALHLPQNLRYLAVSDFSGEKFPLWTVIEMNKLVQVNIQDCGNCRVLPFFSRLPHLKYLDLQFLDVLEYTEDGAGFTDFFPALESLQISYMKELKDWFRVDNGHENKYFPRLSRLVIKACPKLLSMPRAPRLEALEVDEINGKLLKFLLNSHNLRDAEPSVVYDSVSCLTALESLKIHNLENLTALPEQIGNLSELRVLTIKKCPKLVSFPQSFQSLTSLQQLWIEECPDLEQRYQQPDGEDWPVIQHIPGLYFV